MEHVVEHHADTAVEFLAGSNLAVEVLTTVKAKKADPDLIYSALTSLGHVGRRAFARKLQKALESSR